MKKVFFSVGVIALLAAGSVTANAQMNMKSKTTTTQKGKYTHAMFKVKGNCETCKARIEKAALGVKGVESAMWDAKTGVLHLNFDPKLTSEKAVSKAVAAVGHDTQFDKASDKVYNALPGCCKYRR